MQTSKNTWRLVHVNFDFYDSWYSKPLVWQPFKQEASREQLPQESTIWDSDHLKALTISIFTIGQIFMELMEQNRARLREIPLNSHTATTFSEMTFTNGEWELLTTYIRSTQDSTDLTTAGPELSSLTQHSHSWCSIKPLFGRFTSFSSPSPLSLELETRVLNPLLMKFGFLITFSSMKNWTSCLPHKHIIFLTTIKNGMKAKRTHTSQNTKHQWLNSSTLIATPALENTNSEILKLEPWWHCTSRQCLSPTINTTSQNHSWCMTCGLRSPMKANTGLNTWLRLKKHSRPRESSCYGIEALSLLSLFK